MWIFDKIYVIPFLIILLTTIIIELSIKKNNLQQFIGRKLLHIIAICCCAIAINNSAHLYELSFVFLAFSLILLVLVYKDFFSAQYQKSYGIALFPLAFFILLQFNFLTKNEILFAVLTLGFSDAIAGYVGHTFGKKQIKFLQETKSWIGFVTFYIVCIMLYFFLYGFSYFYVAFIVALIPALSELFSYKGSDNLTVPILTALWLHIINAMPSSILFSNLVYVLIIILCAILAYRKKWLTMEGNCAAILVGCLVIFSKDIMHLLPLAIFFATGSIASKLNKNIAEKNGRNAIQVFANGLVATICLLLFYFTKNEVYYIAFFASIAISMTDTLSSEIGKYAKQPTYDIIQLKKASIGLSGGISFAGTIAGLLATVFYSTIIYFIFSLSITHTIIIAFIGFTGMLLDSILGSVVQAKYKTTNGIIVETENGKLIKGFAWCTNDVVNIMSNLIAIILFIVYSKLI
jgi:uncharacterized protein (TIGR00297 family)